MKGKKVSESRIVMAHQMLPSDANPSGNVHGGVIMKHVDTAGGVVGRRHTRANVVTASIDQLDFHHPVYIGDLLILKASLNMVGRTSLEIGVRIEAENHYTGQVRHTGSAYLTYVALDENGKPVEVPPLILETGEDKRRNQDAGERRRLRLAERNEKSRRRMVYRQPEEQPAGQADKPD